MLIESLDDPVESGVSFEFSLIQKAGMMVPYPSSSKNPRFSGPTAGSFSCAKLNCMQGSNLDKSVYVLGHGRGQLMSALVCSSANSLT